MRIVTLQAGKSLPVDSRSHCGRAQKMPNNVDKSLNAGSSRSHAPMTGPHDGVR